MYILTRYVVTEVLKYFLLTLMGLTLIVTVVMGVKARASARVSAHGDGSLHAIHAAGNAGHYPPGEPAACGEHRVWANDGHE